MWNLKNKINKQAKHRLTHREQTDGCQMGGVVLLGWVEKVKGLKVQIGSYRVVTGYKVQHRGYSQ